MHRSGDVVLAYVQFADQHKLKKRPAVVLFEEYGNIVVAGITSNTHMNGIKESKKDGAIKDSVIKCNYIFIIAPIMIQKILFHLPSKIKKKLYQKLDAKLQALTQI